MGRIIAVSVAQYASRCGMQDLVSHRESLSLNTIKVFAPKVTWASGVGLWRSLA